MKVNMWFGNKKKMDPVKISLPSMDWLADIVVILGNIPGNHAMADVGAHIGQVSRKLSRQFPGVTVYAFEPILENFEKLAAKSKDFPKIVPIRQALSSESGSLKVFLSTETSTHSIEPNQNRDIYHRGEEIIDVTTLSEIAWTWPEKHLALLKIDTEGHDLKVLQGGESLLLEQKVDFVLTESGFGGRFVPMDTLRAWLLERGYHLFGIYDQKQHWSGKRELDYFNLLFVRKGLANAKV